MRIEEYRKLISKSKRKNKYNAKPVVIDGFRFDSTREGKYYQKLKLAKASGELIDFYRQVPFKLPGDITYRLDFLEVWKHGVIHTDTKGFSTRVSSMKIKQVEEIYNIKIEVV